MQRTFLNQEGINLQQILGLVTWPEEEHCVRGQKMQLHHVTVLSVQGCSAVCSREESLFFLTSMTMEGPRTELGRRVRFDLVLSRQAELCTPENMACCGGVMGAM